MPRGIDYTGMKFNKLTCIDRMRKNGRIYYNCLCDCGNYKIIRGDSVVSGHTKSCGNCPLNTYNLSNVHGVGYTQSNEKFHFSLEDYDKIKPYNWHQDAEGYIATTIDGRHTYMHRFLLNPKSSEEVDHKNRRKQDNRRCNLRIATRYQNAANSSINKNNKSGVTGVYFDKDRDKWAVQITKNGTVYSLGRFDNKEDAIKTRLEKELELFGEFSPNYKLNNKI